MRSIRIERISGYIGLEQCLRGFAAVTEALDFFERAREDRYMFRTQMPDVNEFSVVYVGPNPGVRLQGATYMNNSDNKQVDRMYGRQTPAPVQIKGGKFFKCASQHPAACIHHDEDGDDVAPVCLIYLYFAR